MNLVLKPIPKKLFVSLLFFICCKTLPGQVVIPMDPILVTASRLYSGAGADTREIAILEKNEIASLPVQSIEELLRYVGNVNLSNRGHGNVQCDFSIRGSSFEQVLILVDGIRYNNPQTGHHNCDLPVMLSDIQRVEVMPGHGSALYGPDSFGGVIHIITKMPQQKRSRLELRGGSYNTWMGRFSQSFRLGKTMNQFGIEKQNSDGYRFDTEYDICRLTGQSQTTWGQKTLTLSGGYLNKDFGANGFYADLPSHEETKTFDGRAAFRWHPNSSHSVKADLYFNRHDDHFILDIDGPGDSVFPPAFV